jgi:glucose-6-phosphate isomerase
MQLILDGPKDKVVFLLSSKKSKSSSKTIDDANLLELNATQAALKEKHVPTLKIEIKDINPSDLGSLFIMFELIVTLIGIRLDINPFDQPAVELIKKRLP